MRQSKRTIATVAFVAGLAAGLAPMGVARGAEGSDVEDLRREVSRMRAEVQALQVAVMQANELEQQRTARLSKALEEQAVPADPPTWPAPVPEGGEAPRSAPPPQVAPPAGRDDKGKGASHRRHRRSGRSHKAHQAE